MRYLSVCSGIEAATVAWHPLGWTPVAFAEIESFPSAVLAHHYPDVPNWGDLTRFHEWPDADVDVLVGGTPCQSFSVAGLRKGLADPRGNLALTFLAIADRYRPRWVVWENVPGVFSADSHDAPDPRPPADPVDLECDGQEVDVDDEYDADEVHAFACLVAGFSELGYFGAYGSLDAQYFHLAQRRKRVFAVFHLGDWQRAAAVLFDRTSLSGHPAPRREAGEGIADSVAGSLGSPGNRSHTELDGHGAYVPQPIPLQYAEQLGREKRQNGMGLGDPGDPMYTLECRQAHGVAYEVAHALRADGFDASEDGTGRGTPIVPVFAQAVADHLIAGEQRIYTHEGKNFRTRNVVAFDTTQITHPENRSNPQPDGPAPSLAKGAHPPAIAFSVGNVARGAGAEPSSDVFPTLKADHGRGRSDQAPCIGFSVKDHGADAGEIAPTLRAGGHAESHANGGVMPAVAFTERTRADGRNLEAQEELAYTLTNPGDGGRTQERNLLTPCMAVRRLTPRECERLQGFPDDYTLIPYRGKSAADGPRYKALGNSMPVPVMRWIGERVRLVQEVIA